MKNALLCTAAIALLGLNSISQADVFNLGPGLTNLETVTVGNPGNAGNGNAMGAVNYIYNISKYEVTAGQYCDFLNAVAKTDAYGLYTPAMDIAVNSYGCNIKRTGSSGSYVYTVTSDWANRPVNYVDYWSACRFANWLGNGQGDGDTENGAYTLSGYDGDHGDGINRNDDWTWAVTSEFEWYKAAYYDPDKPGEPGYWKYATRYDDTPSNTGSDGYTDPGNHANCQSLIDYSYTMGSPYYRTAVGEFENSASAYGTYDQDGNVWEWNETNDGYRGASFRGLMGGAFDSIAEWDLGASGSYIPRAGNTPSARLADVGFRVVQAVPEPSSILALLTGVSGLGFMRRRRTSQHLISLH